MPPTKQEEQKLCDGLVRVAALVKEGHSPTDAIIKVAKDDRIPAGHIRIMTYAYNSGRTNRQRSDASDLFDKVAEFKLADPQEIINAIYPKQVKTAAEVSRETEVSEEYNYSPDWIFQKIASDRFAGRELDYKNPEVVPLPRDQERFLKKANGYLQRLNNERSRLSAELQLHHDKVAAAYSGLRQYFRRVDRLPFEDVQANAEAIYGAPATIIFDKLAESCCDSTKPMLLKKPKKKVVPAKPVMLKRSFVTSHQVDRNKEPYSLVDNLLSESRQHQECFDKAAAFEKAAVQAELDLEHALRTERPSRVPDSPSLSVIRRLNGEKWAFVGDAAGTLLHGAELGLGSESGKSIISKLQPKSNERLQSEADTSLADPSHEARLRSIRSQSALHGILNGPYFEGEDPEKVTQLFNNLTRLSPRMADQPLLLEAAMRRLAAQGAADPHDLDQLLGIETKIKMRNRSPREESTSGE